MSAVGDLHRLAIQRAESPAWRLLRADNADLILTLLGRHFRHDIRRMPAPELFELLDADLEALRDDGRDLPKTARGYCADWVRAGFLLRRSSSTMREESLEPTDAAFTALAFTTGLAEPARTVTESRLSTLATSLAALARDSDPGAESRLERLRMERDAIDQQIAAVESGDFSVLDGDRAVERATEILLLAEEIPGDFARVRAAFDSLNRDLRARIIDDDNDRGDTLGDVFRGVDLIAESDAGRSFNAFYDTILDPTRSAEIDDAVNTVLERPFADRLTPQQRRRFRALLTDMESSAAEVHATMTSLSRSLRHFVQSRAYEEHRRIQQLIRVAQQKGREVAKLRRPYDLLDLDFIRVGMPMTSVAALRLHNPADNKVVEEVVIHAAGTADLSTLRRLVRESEIDFAELRDNVIETIDESGRAGVADVLARHPATQGLASVVGLLVLAIRHGHRIDGTEQVSWISAGGIARSATIARHVFDPSAPEFCARGSTPAAATVGDRGSSPDDGR